MPENCGRYGRAVDQHIGIVEVKAALAVHEEGYLTVLNRVVTVSGFVIEGERSVYGTFTIAGGEEGVCEQVTSRIFVVVEITGGAFAFRTWIEAVDEHRGHVRRTRNLDAGGSRARLACMAPTIRIFVCCARSQMSGLHTAIDGRIDHVQPRFT